MPWMELVDMDLAYDKNQCKRKKALYTVQCTVHITGAMQPLCGETTSPVTNISSEHIVTFLLGCQAQFPAVQLVWAGSEVQFIAGR